MNGNNLHIGHDDERHALFIHIYESVVTIDFPDACMIHISYGLSRASDIMEELHWKLKYQ